MLTQVRHAVAEEEVSVEPLIFDALFEAFAKNGFTPFSEGDVFGAIAADPYLTVGLIPERHLTALLAGNSSDQPSWAAPTRVTPLALAGRKKETNGYPRTINGEVVPTAKEKQ